MKVEEEEKGKAGGEKEAHVHWVPPCPTGFFSSAMNS